MRIVSKQMNEMVDKKWYVMRSLFRTELKTQAKLSAAGIESFVPTQTRVVVLHGRKKRIETPIVSNLIFVHSDLATLQPFTEQDGRFQFIFVKGGRQNERMFVEDADMRRFLDAFAAAEKPLLFNPSELNLEKGTKVKIVGGEMDGVEGVFMRVRGARNKRLVVIIPDTLALAVEVYPDLVEVLNG